MIVESMDKHLISILGPYKIVFEKEAYHGTSIT